MKKFSILIILLFATHSLSAQTIQNGVLTISEGTTEIKTKAYYGNTEIKKVIIPNSVTKIGGLAFHSCTNLVEIDIPSSVITIDDAAFQNCTSLSKVILHKGLTKLSLKLFKSTAITEITIPATVTEFGSDIFSDCKNLTTIRVDKYSEAHAFFSMNKKLMFTDNQPVQSKEQWLAAAKKDVVDDGVLYIKPGKTAIGNHAYYGNKTFTKVVIPSSVTSIGGCAFYETKLESVRVPGNVKKVDHEAFRFTPAKEIIFEEGVEEIGSMACYTNIGNAVITIPDSVKKMPTTGEYAGIASPSQKWIVVQGSYAQEYHHGRCPLKIDYSQPYSAYSGDKAINVSIEENIPADYFKHCPNLKSVDIGPNVTKILPNTFPKNVTLRVKYKTYADKWAKDNGYYLCGVLADLNTYTNDKSKEIKVDFTRIACDDTPYAEWTSYSFTIQQPLKLEEVDNKLVLTSFMLYPCQNVTVTDKNGKTLISKKTIYPLTRTILCDFDFITDDVKNYTVTSDDSLYRKIVSIPTKWGISFQPIVRRKSMGKDVLAETMTPLYVRHWIANAYDMAYVLGLPEYDKRCYEAVENKELATNKALTEFMTKEKMEKLIKQARNWSLCLGRDNLAGTGGGTTLTLMADWILILSSSTHWTDTHAFWHEFSHCMGYSHEAGNMCNMELPKPWGEQCWPSIASKLYVEEVKKGNPPYFEGQSFFNAKLFSQDGIHPKRPDDDVIKNGTLYIAEDMPYVESHKGQSGINKVVFSQSVEVLRNSAFYGTALNEITITPNITKIGNTAFHSCIGLKSVDIPDTVKSIGDASFQNCKNLRSVKIGKGLRQLNYRLFKGTALTEINIPANVKIIGNETFADCKNLKKIVLNNGVCKIGDGAFSGSAINEITIPSSVTEIGSNAFNNTALKEITIPDTVTKLGSNITSHNVVWNVKPGTAVYDYAVKNKYNMKLPQDYMAKLTSDIVAQLQADGNAPTDKWQTNTFSASDVRRKFDFSSALNGDNKYFITFRYTGGESMLCVSDVLFVADGKGAAYFPKMRTAGDDPREIKYELDIPRETKRLELYANVKRSGNASSNGTIKIESYSDKIAKILSESENGEAVLNDVWQNGTFTKNDVRRKWDFSDKLIGTNGGEYFVRFIYAGGSDILRLTDTLFTADGKAIAHFAEMRSVGFNQPESIYNITIPRGTKKLEMFALARAGSSNNSGVAFVFPHDDGTPEYWKAKVNAECKIAPAAPTDKWDKNTFLKNEVRRKWDFSSSVKGGGEYVVTFGYTDGDNILCLREAMFTADGKTFAEFPEMRMTGAGNQTQIVYQIDIPKGTKKLNLFALTSKTGGGSFDGIISIETLADKAAKAMFESKKSDPAPIDKWKSKIFTTEYVRYKWDFTSLIDGGGKYTVTFKSTGGDEIFSIYDVIFTADGKPIAFYPDKWTLSVSPNHVDFQIDVPNGTKKLEMFGFAKGKSGSGNIKVEKE